MPQISLTVTAEQAQRIGAALGRYLRLGRDATLAEVKSFLVDRIRAMVRQEERAAQEAALTIPELGAIE